MVARSETECDDGRKCAASFEQYVSEEAIGADIV